MPPAEYQLDTVAVNLIERMEGSRRTWLDDPEAARAGFRRIAEESLDRVVAEYDGIMGDDGWGVVLRTEILETFLPRYTRIAVVHNALEASRFGAWRGGDPLGRILVTVAALIAAMVLRRVLMFHPITYFFFLAAFLTPVMPEIRGWYHRRQYQQELQRTVNDLERIQRELERYAGTEGYTDVRLEAARRAAAAAAQRRTSKEMG
jgi:hypothetical protein